MALLYLLYIQGPIHLDQLGRRRLSGTLNEPRGRLKGAGLIVLYLHSKAAACE